MKYYIIAGEASGDLHGSNLIRALKKEDPNANIRCWGGDLMEEAGGTLARHYKEMAFMGFLEVLLNLGTILKNIRFCKEDITKFSPDVIIFIDFSGFNLRIAQWAKTQNFTTNYYISPQVWASRAGRVEKIKRDIDHMYVILPFETEFYAQKGMEVTFVGHPLLDAMENRPEISSESFREAHGLDPKKPVIALLPGSRKQEVSRMLAIMLQTSADYPQYQFVVAGAPGLDASFYKEILKDSNVTLIRNKTYELLSISEAALVTSGTATLETALIGIPQVVCYKGNWLSYQIAKRLITLNYISLVNLIMGKEVVEELIQSDLTPNNLSESLRKILSGPEREQQIKDYQELKEKLGGPGASRKTARLILEKM
ncbi:lipid-A-disaccharide synthase [Lentiprolixibacter aurantiacus]|uniref:Lipid-A-disaccharide synthase n=1 Tax=Lentiprolixibacter aurantiacus TaxID=2993939 RepID=A0AAE3MHV8_9FLAO|nr:lipid-A-disaccharide synthase [Lentiprolixibacter aurantiacus]MCX2718075.1 lipid-A-disaccharide synthase [Lentiprolixibacter aurantiacus]